MPCFELWLLLHYADIQAYFERDQIYQRLRAHMPTYEKGLQGVYAATSPTLAVATQRAAALQGRYNAHQGNQPYTNADLLVTLLKSVRATR